MIHVQAKSPDHDPWSRFDTIRHDGRLDRDEIHRYVRILVRGKNTARLTALSRSFRLGSPRAAGSRRMILLDTNVVSAVMRPAPFQSVLDWLDDHDTASLYLSTISIAEIGFDLRVLPDGKRRRSLESRFEEFVAIPIA